MTNTVSATSHQYRASCGTPSSVAIGGPARSPTPAVSTVVSVTAASAVQARSAASRASAGTGTAWNSDTLETTLIIPTIALKTASRPNSAGSYSRVISG